MATKKITIPDDCMPMCKTCAFFLSEPQGEIGECRRYPPTNFAVETTLTYEFSISEPDFWCGEYRRKTN